MKKEIFLITLFPLSLFAQNKRNNGDSLKFEMIKESINFLATDTKTFRNSSAKRSKCINGNYECLKKYCSDNRLDGAQGRIEDWRSKNSNSKTHLTELKNKIVDDLTKGSSSKESRKELPNFNTYQNKLSSLATSFSEETKGATDKEEELGITSGLKQSSKEIQQSSDNGTAILDKGKPETAQTNNEIEQTSEENKAQSKTVEIGTNKEHEMPDINEDPKPGSNLPTIAFLTSLAALVMGIWAFVRSGKRASQDNKSDAGISFLKEEMKELRMRISQKPVVDIRPVQDKLSTLESHIKDLENQFHIAKAEVDNHDLNLKASASLLSQELPDNREIFAYYPDMSNGFSNKVLGDIQKGDLIYEISIKGEKGSFAISDAPGVQAFALSDYKNYLSDACDLINQPYRGCRIITIEKGTLAKSGDNWIIQSKAKIEFK